MKQQPLVITSSQTSIIIQAYKKSLGSRYIKIVLFSFSNLCLGNEHSFFLGASIWLIFLLSMTPTTISCKYFPFINKKEREVDRETQVIDKGHYKRKPLHLKIIISAQSLMSVTEPFFAFSSGYCLGSF